MAIAPPWPMRPGRRRAAAYQPPSWGPTTTTTRPRALGFAPQRTTGSTRPRRGFLKMGQRVPQSTSDSAHRGAHRWKSGRQPAVIASLHDLAILARRQ
eukprot:SAG31_NODE_1993_length_6709_cov_5.744024_1_plen_98_part_00